VRACTLHAALVTCDSCASFMSSDTFPSRSILHRLVNPMHAFTRPSTQLRLKVWDALLRSAHHSSLYRRLIVASKEKRARTKTVGQSLHKRLTHSPLEGTSLLKFVYRQIYKGKLALRYGDARRDECPLCHMPDACTHIAGECPDHKAMRISRHNAASQLIHAAIRRTAKGGGALHSAHDIVLVFRMRARNP
jgi:hypothetical protein